MIYKQEKIKIKILLKRSNGIHLSFFSYYIYQATNVTINLYVKFINRYLTHLMYLFSAVYYFIAI
jgi:hypothetical protein